MKILLESCVDSFEAARASARGGAARIELCANLDLAGTTPDAGLTARCAAELKIPVFIMVRPRGGAFVYDREEARVIERDVRAAASLGARGVVIGALRPDGSIDTTLMKRLIAAARPLPVTCHRAIDASRDPIEALEALLRLGVDRVLTSGGAASAAAGARTLAKMVARAGDDMVVMAGGRVRASNVGALVERTGVREVHARLVDAEPVPAGMTPMASLARTVAAFVAALAS